MSDEKEENRMNKEEKARYLLKIKELTQKLEVSSRLVTELGRKFKEVATALVTFAEKVSFIAKNKRDR